MSSMGASQEGRNGNADKIVTEEDITVKKKTARDDLLGRRYVSRTRDSLEQEELCEGSG